MLEVLIVTELDHIAFFLTNSADPGAVLPVFVRLGLCVRQLGLLESSSALDSYVQHTLVIVFERL